MTTPIHPEPNTTAEAREELVVLVDEDGRPTGTAAKASVHHANTPLHLAFSCYILSASPAPRLLVTRRALSKVAWPGIWTNSVCGHPGPGEPVTDAIARRARQELGMDLSGIRCVLPEFSYRAQDSSGIVEWEVCPVYVAIAVSDPQPADDEVDAWEWADPAGVLAAVDATPFAFSPWMVEQLAHPDLRDAILRGR